MSHIIEDKNQNIFENEIKTETKYPGSNNIPNSFICVILF